MAADRRELLEKWREERRNARRPQQHASAFGSTVSVRSDQRRSTATTTQQAERRRRSDLYTGPTARYGERRSDAMSPPVARRKSDLYDGRHAEYPTTPPLPSKPVEVTMPVPQSGYTDTSRESEKPLERELLGDRDHKKRRKSFLSPSPAAPFLAGGAQRVLTPSRATQRVDGRLDESNNEAGSDVDAPDAAATTPSKTVQPNQRAVPVGDEMDLTTVSLDASVTLGIDRTIDLSDGSRGAVSTTGEASSKEQEVRGEVKAVSSGTGQMRGALRIPHVQPTRSRESHSSSLEEDRANLHRADGVVLEGERGQYTGRNTASTSSISMFDSRNPGRSSAPRRVAIRVRAEATTHPTTKESQSSMDPTDAKTNAVEGAWPLNTVVDRNERNSKWEMDDFVVTKNLGQGKFGNVYLAKEKASNMTVALKVLFRATILREKAISNLKREIEIQVRMHHPNILRLFGYFYTESCIYLILEYAPHGELFKELSRQQHFDEPLAAHYVAQVVEALRHCHSCGVIHRDIKPENLLIGLNQTVKLADFGWSVHAPSPHNRRMTFCGTPDYLSPEMVLGKPYDFRTDSWSLGVLTYELLFGTTPFYAENQMEMYKRIELVDYTFPEAPAISTSAKSFIAGLLQVNPDDRMSLENAAQHAWVRNQTSQ